MATFLSKETEKKSLRDNFIQLDSKGISVSMY